MHFGPIEETTRASAGYSHRGYQPHESSEEALHLYDTSAALLTAPNLAGSPRWAVIRQTIKPSTGEVNTRHILNTERGLHLTLINGITLIAERSLPKALYGTNVDDLTQDEVPDALGKFDREIGEALHVDLPPVGTWAACRADYCRNDELGDELAVRRALLDARNVQLPRRGRPVCGDSGTSLRWLGSAYQFKLYGKLAESGDTAATGVLRAEATVRHAKTFRELTSTGPGEVVQLLDVLTPHVRDQVLARFSDVFERVHMSERELSDWDFCQEFTDYFSGRRAMQLLGFTFLYQLAGFPSASEIAKGRQILGFKRSTMYRALADLRAFRLHLVEQGYQRPALLANAANTYERGLDELAAVAFQDDEHFVRYVASLKRYTRQEAA